MWSWLFWRDAGERAIRAAASSTLGVVGAGPVLGLLDVDVVSTLSVAGLAAVVSVLTSVAASRAGDSATAGFATGSTLPG